MIPKIGLGTWKLSDKAQLKPLVSKALDEGYRHFDSAAIYENERVLGECLREAMAERGLHRHDIFLTSKLWNTDHRNVMGAVKRSLGEFGFDYLDLYLVHWPIAFLQDPLQPPLTSKRQGDFPILDTEATLEGTWRQMEAVKDAGLAKAVGVSNFNMARLQRILAISKIKPLCNQVEMHPYLRQTKLRAFCAEHGIEVVAYSPLGSGKVPVLEDLIVKKIAQKSQLTPAQVCLAWAVGHGCPVIPKTSSPERLHENAHFKELSGEDMAAIDAIATDGERACDPKDWSWGINCFEAD